MGNTMNVAVISQVYQSNRQELLALKKKAEKDGKKTIHREGWEAAEVACSVDESDRDIHERLFTLYDKKRKRRGAVETIFERFGHHNQQHL